VAQTRLLDYTTLVPSAKFSREVMYRRTYTLTAIILETHKMYSNVLTGVFADPNNLHKRGIGKSVYSIKIIMQVYNVKDWPKIREYIVFTPEDFVKILDKLINENIRLPLLVWDDAGFWLNKQRWMNKFVIAVRENMNVIRSYMTSIIFTSPTYVELARGIRDHLDLAVLIRLKNYDPDPQKRYSRGRGYKHSEDLFFTNKKRPEPIFEDMFKLWLPDRIFWPYDEFRKEYVKIGLQRMKQRIHEIVEELNEVSSQAEPNKKVDKYEVEEEFIEELQDLL